MTEDKTRTSIDLGDDLLEDDESSPHLEAENPKSPLSEGVQEAIQSARILLTEGLLEEAKKVLYQILRSDTRNILVRELLQEIHQIELRQIFSNAPPQRNKSVDWETIQIEDLVVQLENALGVPDEEEILHEMLGDESVIRQYCQKQKEQIGELSDRDRVDLAVGYLEMGLAPLALEYLRDLSEEREWELVRANLSAMAYLQMGRPYDATLALEKVIHDLDWSIDERRESIYWMGRAYERLHKPIEAMNIYQMISDPEYRDAKRRIQRISKK